MGRVLFVGKHGREAVARDDELLLRALLGIFTSYLVSPFPCLFTSTSSEFKLCLHPCRWYGHVMSCTTEKRVSCLGDTVPDGLRKRLHPAPSQLN